MWTVCILHCTMCHRMIAQFWTFLWVHDTNLLSSLSTKVSFLFLVSSLPSECSNFKIGTWLNYLERYTFLKLHLVTTQRRGVAALTQAHRCPWIALHNNRTFWFCEHHYKRIANMHSLSLSFFFLVNQQLVHSSVYTPETCLQASRFTCHHCKRCGSHSAHCFHQHDLAL